MIILPIDFHIFQKGRYTTNQIWLDKVDYYVPIYYKPIINPYINGIMWYNFNLWLIMLINVVKTMSKTTHFAMVNVPPIEMVMTGGWFIFLFLTTLQKKIMG